MTANKRLERRKGAAAARGEVRQLFGWKDSEPQGGAGMGGEADVDAGNFQSAFGVI
jgi:hypothetical protein